jgi:hypothetical protein
LETLPETTSTTDRADKRVKQVASLKVEGPERDIVSNIAAILATQLGKIALQYVQGIKIVTLPTEICLSLPN